MEIDLLFFGIVREITGRTAQTITVPLGSRIEDLSEILKKDYPGLTDLKSYAFAVNENYVQSAYQLQHGDTVAIIPPVSGG